MKDKAAWVWERRRKVLAVALVSLPLVARYVPGFPTEEAVNVIRILLGA